jgi:DNA-binding transcriptional MerR regulator
MKSGMVARLMGRDPDTIINWTRRPELSKFFSAGVMVKGNQRDFNDSDVQVVNTIRALLAEGATWADIAVKLTAGERVLEFPPSAAGVEGITPVEVYGAGVAKTEQLKAAETRIRELEDKLETLEQRKDAEIQALNDKRMEEKENLLIQLGAYKARLADARAEIERLKKASDNPG